MMLSNQSFQFRGAFKRLIRTQREAQQANEKRMRMKGENHNITAAGDVKGIINRL